jgi:hypothetical protein
MDPVAALIVVGPFDEARLRQLFESVEVAGRHDCSFCMPWRDEATIWIARRPRRAIGEVWPELKNYQ